MFRDQGTPCAASVASWRVASEEQDLEAIFDEDVNLVVWRRPTECTHDVGSFLEPPRRLMRTVRGDFVDAGQIARVLDRAVPCALTADIARLVELFATLAGSSDVGIRLEASTRQTCPKWHTDRVGLRLMTTYCGPGTEWLEGAAIHRAATGDVLLAKGESWPSTPGACVHRSPDPSGLPRLLLTLDALD